MGARILAIATTAAALSACAAAPDDYCTEHRLVPITVGDQVHMVRSRCSVRTFAPTPGQVAEFERRQAARRGW